VDGPPNEKPPQVAACEGSDQKSCGNRLSDEDTTGKRQSYTRDRYTAHSHIRVLLIGKATREHPGKHAGNVYRTAACTWVPVTDPSMVRPGDKASYHYKGLVTCGSVWVCPLCASKIQERRRQEVAQAITWATANDHHLVMASFTFPHRIDQPLSLLLKLQSEAITYMRGRKQYIELMKRAGNTGRIRALEVTHGQNGWHPHTHELLMLRHGVPALALRDGLAQIWLKACRKFGLFVEGRDDEVSFLRHSVDVRSGDAGVGDYLAKLDDQSKWGLSHEMTKASSKQGRASGQHPFALAMQKTTTALFLEYVDAMKGQRQLVWSRGLKDAVGVSEKTDEEIAQEQTANVVDSIQLTRPQWRYVVSNDSRAELLHAAESGGLPAVRKLLHDLGCKYESSVPS
jgi:hypothetical protein